MRGAVNLMHLMGGSRLAVMSQQQQHTRAVDRSFTLPPLGDNPSTEQQGTTPGSFANKGRVGTPWTFSSPDTPGMPQPSEKTAWDFLPDDWEVEIVDAAEAAVPASSPCEACAAARLFPDSQRPPRPVPPRGGFEPTPQLEHPRLGIITKEMYRVATREPHLTAAQVRDEVAAGRMVIPANRNHLKHNLDP